MEKKIRVKIVEPLVTRVVEIPESELLKTLSECARRGWAVRRTRADLDSGEEESAA